MTLIRRLAYAALFLQMTLVVTGGAVRVTNSGLGCPTWPRCTGTSLASTPELGIHGQIEFGNRVLAVLMGVLGVVLVLAVWRLSQNRTWLRLAFVQAAVVPLQALVGGLLVLTHLNPYVLIAHFLISFPLIYAAVVLVHRVTDRPRLAHEQLRWLTGGVLTAVVLTLVLGSLVTGTGPHGGGDEVDRLPFNPRELTQLHADAVFLLLGLVLATVLIAWTTPLRRWVVVLLGLVLAQGAIGYAQYFSSVPPLLVGMHVAGATLVFTTAAWLQQHARQPERTEEPTPERARRTATAP